MFYRDDRMVETEHLGLCEVIVTPTPGKTDIGIILYTDKNI